MDGTPSCVSKFVSFPLQVVDPTKIPVYCEGKRVKELGRKKLGTMATLVNRNCIICSRNELSPVMVWFGSGGAAPCVRGAAGEVVEVGKVWLPEEEREVRCLEQEASLEIGEKVLAWGWGGKQGEGGAVYGVVFRPNMSSTLGSQVVDQEIEEEDPFMDIVFSSLVMRIGVDEGSWEEFEELFQLIVEEESLVEEDERRSASRISSALVLKKSSRRSSRVPMLEVIPEEGGDILEEQQECVSEDQGGDFHDEQHDKSLLTDSGFLEETPSMKVEKSLLKIIAWITTGKTKVLHEFVAFLDFPR